MFGLFKTKKKASIAPIKDNPKISVIMPVYLGDYEGAASDREEKFKRAVISFTQQNYQHKELIIVSDGCDIAERIYKSCLVYDVVIFNKAPKQPLFSGGVRHHGINISNGDIICYLDSDDCLGSNHLINIACNFLTKPNVEWVYYNDIIANPYSQFGSMVRNIEPEHGSIGTSAIAHRRECLASWENCDGYGHDWLFIKQLIENHASYKKIMGCEYYVCHIPNIFG